MEVVFVTTVRVPNCIGLEVAASVYICFNKVISSPVGKWSIILGGLSPRWTLFLPNQIFHLIQIMIWNPNRFLHFSKYVLSWTAVIANLRVI